MPENSTSLASKLNVTIVDIKFNEGEISIPQVIIIGRNSITSYVKVMSSLIRSQKDANLLEQLGIIIIESDEISAFFKSLCREVVLADFFFSDLCREVENYKVLLVVCG